MSKFIFSGEEFNGGLVGTYISIEGENYGFVGQLQEIEVPEKERLSLPETAFKNQEFHPTAKAEILLSFDLFEMGKVTKGANVYPTIGAKVFVCTRKFVQKYIQGFGQKENREVLMHIGYLNSDEQTEVTVSNLFLLLKPSERAQAPKLLEAVKTLKTLKIARDSGGLDEYYQNNQEKNVFKKENLSKEGFRQFQRKNYEKIDVDELDFDIRYLARQIQLECIYDMDYRKFNSNFWGGRSDQDSANCISLVTRTNAFVNDKNYKNILGIGSNNGKEDLAETLMGFLKRIQQYSFWMKHINF